MDNSSSVTFGRYLKKIRAEKQISLETVSIETRISVSVLTLIENEDLAQLPADVFVKGFLRAYAGMIGADEDKVVQLYQASLDRFEHKRGVELESTETDARFWPKLLLTVGALCFLMVSAIWLMSLLEKQQPASHDTAVPKPTQKQKMPAAAIKETAASASARVPVSKKKEQAAKEKLLLDVKAVAKTWMRVQVDDQTAREYTLKSGERLALEALEKIDLLIGNAAGVELALNGRPVKLKGKSGQVVSVQLP